MFKLRFGYLVSGIATGLILLFGFLWSLPDGKLHLVFCDVGQGDAAYVRFPDGRDMLVDGGPNDKVLDCLGRHMPFWDRQINLVVLSHPQKDHLQGLIAVLNRFKVDYFVNSNVANDTEGFVTLQQTLTSKKIPIKHIAQGETIDVGTTKLSVIWPSASQLALTNSQNPAVLGATTPRNLNDFSVVLHLAYGAFDALFPGDADNHVNALIMQSSLGDDPIEVLKVPHHGSKTGMTAAYLDWVRPSLAIISVGKNSYGHPTPEILKMLNERSIRIQRTDEVGDIEVTSDGVNWKVQTGDRKE